MSNLPVTPVYGEPALTFDKSLIVAELHIGIEHDVGRKGARIPSQTLSVERRLISLIKQTGVTELIVLGDVKHNIPSISMQEHREIPLLFKSLSDHAEVMVVKGNHDGNLERLLPDVPILESLQKMGVLFIHGHGWVKAERLDAEIVVMAHNHPAIAFPDEFSGSQKEPVWIRGRFNERIREHYQVEVLPEFIVMPAFNPLISGTAVNQKAGKRLLGPFFGSGAIDIRRAHAYLLEGTDLGEISELEASEKKPQ